MKPVISPYNYTAHKTLVIKCIDDLLVKPRFAYKEWSNVTGQTPAAKTGYSYQHLASVITNVKGRGSAARGDDLTDGTEVKACSRVNQLDTCRKCKAGVMRSATVCGNEACKSTSIRRNNDSKWLITIRTEKELEEFSNLKRAIFIIEDYPAFHEGNFQDMRIRAYEIYPRENQTFQKLLNSYFYDVFLPNSKTKSVPAPKNFWPDSYSFHMCAPIKTFEAHILRFESPDYSIELKHLCVPRDFRCTEGSLGDPEIVDDMPTALLNEEERAVIGGTLPAALDVEQRALLQLR